MNVNPAGNTGPVSDMKPSVKAPRERIEADQASFPELDTLARALESTPDARESEVLRARELVGDINYPPAEVVRRLAKLLSIHLTTE